MLLVMGVAAAAGKSLQSCLTLATPYTADYQVPLSLGFSRQEYWSGLPSPSPAQRQDRPVNPSEEVLRQEATLNLGAGRSRGGQASASK